MFRTGFPGLAGNGWDVNGEQMGKILSIHHSNSFGTGGYVAAIPACMALNQCANCLIQAAGVSLSSFTDENIKEGMTEQEEDLVKWAANAIIGGA